MGSTPWTSRQIITGLTHRDIQPFTLTFTPMGNLESPINLHIFGLWEEAGVPRENPRRHGENMQTPHREALSHDWESNAEPSYCEAPVLTTVPLTPCHPTYKLEDIQVIILTYNVYNLCPRSYI